MKLSLANRIKRISLLISKFRTHVKVRGFGSALRRTIKYINYKPQYAKWFSTPLYTDDELETQKHDVFDKVILFSIITPLYNTDIRYLKDMINSVKSQTYSNWELCLADGSDDSHNFVGDICREYASKDSRIKYKKLEKNLGIIGNSNDCMKMATGSFISLLDHDDILNPAALHDVMKVICEKDSDFIYTDEMVFKDNDIHNVVTIHFKPDFAPDNLRSNNYICHFTSFRRTLLGDDLLFRNGYEGSQDHDLVLRLTQRTNRIFHIPEVLYYWRSCNGSTAESVANKPYCSESGQKAVYDSLKEQGIEATVESVYEASTIYRVKYKLKEPLPKVSIIIPTRNHLNDLRECITSIREKTTYKNYELIIVDNESVDKAALDYIKELQDTCDDVRVVRVEGDFNWSLLNNRGVEAATGDYYLFLNNDTAVITPEWIEELLMFAQRNDVGVVGAKLYYTNSELIQHAGVILGMGKMAAHPFSGFNKDSLGYMGKLSYAQNYSAVTGACQLMRKEVYDQIGGYDECISIHFGDIDFCLKVRRMGYLIVWTPFAELYHATSKSRAEIPDTPERMGVREKEYAQFIRRWKQELVAGDPYYNPNLSLKNTSFELKAKQGIRVKEYNYD